MSLEVTTSGVNRVLGATLLVIAFAMLGAGSYMMRRTHLDELIFRRAAADGRVIENRAVRNRGHLSYLAMVQFQDGEGQMVTHADWVSMDPATFRVGEHVTVYYDPRNPQNAVIDRGTFNYILPGMWFGITAFVILGGVYRMRTGKA